jgi:hypothetical protein
LAGLATRLTEARMTTAEQALFLVVALVAVVAWLLSKRGKR